MRIFSSAVEKLLFWREFWILWGAGLIADALLVAISRLPTTPLAMFLFVKDNPQKPVLLAIAAAETVMELALIVGLGLLAAHSIGLGAPMLEKWLRSEPIRPHLRSVFVPALLVGISLGAWSVVPALPILHPYRQSIHRETENILDSPARAKVTDFVKRTMGRQITRSDLAVSYVFEAISGELAARLFLLSSIAWILTKIMRNTPGARPRTLLWIAIFLVAAVGDIRYLAWQSAFNRLFSNAVGGIPLANDPFWLVATRVVLGSIPAGVGLGWLYTRRGLESAMTGSLIASVVGYAVTSFLLVRLY
jgi:hypothetical protein